MPDCLLLRGGHIADGTGGDLRDGDVLIVDGKIADPRAVPATAHVLDCTGLTVAPGFIDAHSHSDLQVLGNHPEKLLQGVTSEIVGNCGFSPYPSGGRDEELREFANGILFGGREWGWDSAKAYLDAVRHSARFAAVYSLVGHGSLRIAVAGHCAGPLADPLVDHMEGILREALSDGAAGFSTGLMYAPGASAPFDELLRLCRVVAAQGKVYCTHMRDYGSRLLEAIDEQLELARRTGCRLQISHLQAVGRGNWRLNRLALDRIETARAEGIDVAFDCYPYVAGSTVLTQLLPQWTLDGGVAGLVRRLSDREERARIAKETLAGMVHEWSDLIISAVGSESNRHVVGQTVEAIARDRNREPVEVIFDLLIEERGTVNILEFNQSEENLRQNLTHPQSIIISDGFYVSGKPHPRLHGTFPELLGNVTRNRKWLSLPEAIRKITGSPADRFGLAGKGYLRPGYDADITVFDAESIESRATYADPRQDPVGIRWVLRQGRILFDSKDRAA